MDPEIERLRKKIENYPSPSAFNRLADLLFQAGEHAEAEEVCRRCLRQFPRNTQIYVVLAELLLHSDKRAEAIGALNKALATDPRHIAAHTRLAQLHMEAGDRPRALAHAEQLRSLRPQDPEAERIIAALRTPGTAAATPVHRHPSGEYEATQAAAKPQAEDTIDLSMGRSLTTANLRQKTDGRGSDSPTMAAHRALQQRMQTPAGGICALDGLLGIDGVQGAVVADDQGRTVISLGLDDGRDDMLAAYGQEVGRAGGAVLSLLGHGDLCGWTVVGSDGQAIAVRRDAALSLTSLASARVKVAMLELRARQALIDLGAS